MMSRLRQLWGSITRPLQAYRDIPAELCRKFSLRVSQRINCIPEYKSHRKSIATSHYSMNNELYYISP